MAASKDYLPKKESELAAFLTAFAAKIALAPTVYGLTSSVSDDLTAKTGAFASALAASTDPTTRGARTVFLKKQAKTPAVKITRQIAAQLATSMNITDAQRQELGLPIRSGHRTPNPAPDVAPALFVKRVDNRNVTLELRQSKTRRGKPEGVAVGLVFTASTPTGTGAPSAGDPAWQFAASTSLTTVQIPCGSSATGDAVHFTAYWQNSKAESGPAANPVSVNLPAGGVMPKEMPQAQMKLRAA